MQDLPLLAQSLREHTRGFVCLMPLSPFPRPVAEWLRQSIWGAAPVPRLVPLPLLAPLLNAGRPVGSAEFEPFGVAQVPSLRLTDAQDRWALPLLLATGADPHLVSPPPSPQLTGTLAIRGRMLRLAAPGRFLVNVYGSQPGAIFPHVSYSAVLNGEPLYDRRLGRWVPARQFFRDRIVFLDTLNQPSYDTPVGTFQATELLAMATDNLLTMDVLAPLPPRAQLLLLICCSALAGHLAIGRSPLMGAVRMTLLLVFYWLVAAVLFIWPGAWLPIVSVTVAIGLAYLLVAQFVFTADEMELERQRHQQAQFEQEVDIGRAIQTSLLPPGHLAAGAFEMVSRSVPAREVGGDFYNLFPLSESSQPRECSPAAGAPAPRTDQPAIGIVLGDVSGKGVQGAMYMTVTTTLLEARAARGVAPEAVLAGANAHLYPKIHGLRMFVTVFYGILDVGAGKLEFASAGQVPPVLAPSAEPPRYAACRGTPLGALRNSRYQRQSLVLAPGDTLLLASDGFVEARAPGGKVLGYDGFLDMVGRHVKKAPSRCLTDIFKERSSSSAAVRKNRTIGRSSSFATTPRRPLEGQTGVPLAGSPGMAADNPAWRPGLFVRGGKHPRPRLKDGELMIFRKAAVLLSGSLLSISVLGCGSGGSGGVRAVTGPASTLGLNPRYHGGPVLPHAGICTLFWGPELEQASLHRYFDGFFQALFADGRFMANLAQYSAGSYQIGNGRLMATTNDGASLPATVTDAQIQAEISAQVAAGKLPAPDANTLYFVLIPAEVIVVDPHGFDSDHHFTGYHSYSPSGGFAYAVVIAASQEEMTITASHELAEVVTDPQSDTWATVAWIDDQYGEIADIVQNMYAAGQIGRGDYLDTLTGGNGTSYVVQKVWSVKAGAPAAFAGRAGAGA